MSYLGLAGVNLNTDTISWYLSNATPNVSTMSVKADLAEITNQNGYTAPIDSGNSYSVTTGIGTLVCTDGTVTASGGTVGPFQHIGFYDDTHASDILMGYVSYASAITLADGESFVTDFGAYLATFGG